MITENLEWLVLNALHGDVSGENPDDLRRIIRAKYELDSLSASHSILLALHNALVEAVAWLREVDDTREWLSEFPWLRKWSGLDQCMNEARAEVDRLIGGE